MPSPPKIKRQLPEPTNSFRQGTPLEFHRCYILIAPSLANKRSSSTTELNVHNMAKVIPIAAHCSGRVVLHHLQLTAERKNPWQILQSVSSVSVLWANPWREIF